MFEAILAKFNFAFMMLRIILMIKLSEQEARINQKIKELKQAAGSHSPSIFTLAEQIPELKIKVDACFLSNPYATELFLSYLQKELINTAKLRDYLEFYPSQNQVIATAISQFLGINAKNIFIGNGAIEIIQAVLHRFVDQKLVVNIPTFSSYYEFVRKDTQVVYYQLLKENNYTLDLEHYLAFLKQEKPDSIVLINPNNPDGSYIKIDALRALLKELDFIKNIILDESFVHFAYEDEYLNLVQLESLFDEFDNLIIIKSMSKDFGVAGIRIGYAIMDEQKVSSLLENGYLWNSSGLAEYFLRLYVREDFFKEYETIRKLYIKQTQKFFKALSEIKEIKVYPSQANFALVELLDESLSADFVAKLLIKYGIYTRTCSDKVGLKGEFVRIASRSKEENLKILESIQQVFKE